MLLRASEKIKNDLPNTEKKGVGILLFPNKDIINFIKDNCTRVEVLGMVSIGIYKEDKNVNEFQDNMPLDKLKTLLESKTCVGRASVKFPSGTKGNSFLFSESEIKDIKTADFEYFNVNSGNIASNLERYVKANLCPEDPKTKKPIDLYKLPKIKVAMPNK